MVEALVSDGADEAFSEGIAVGAVARYADTLDAIIAEYGTPCLGEERVPIVDEVSGEREESVTAAEEVSGGPLHPGIVRSDTDTSDVHLAGLEFHHEEGQVTYSAKGAKCLDGGEVAGVESIPVAFEEMPPRFPARAFRLEARSFVDAGHRGAGDVMLQAPKGVTDPGPAMPRPTLRTASSHLQHQLELIAARVRWPVCTAIVDAVSDHLGPERCTAR